MCATQGVQVQGSEQHPSCGCRTAVTPVLTDLSYFWLVLVCLIYGIKYFFRVSFKLNRLIVWPVLMKKLGETGVEGEKQGEIALYCGQQGSLHSASYSLKVFILGFWSCYKTAEV